MVKIPLWSQTNNQTLPLMGSDTDFRECYQRHTCVPSGPSAPPPRDTAASCGAPPSGRGGASAAAAEARWRGCSRCADSPSTQNGDPGLSYKLLNTRIFISLHARWSSGLASSSSPSW